MFYGEHEHSIDRKGRLIIPSKFREVFKEHYVERFFVTRGLDTCLFVFTEDEWKKQESKFKSLSFTNSQARQFNRLYFSGACEVTCDRQGRILIPPYLKEFAKIAQFIVITHNKKTISSANVMYGITMPETGISRIVSVKFSDEKKEEPALAAA